MMPSSTHGLKLLRTSARKTMRALLGLLEHDEIFLCNEEKHGLVYEGYFGDGDSKRYHTVANVDPPIYTDTQTKKLECCGHMQNQMGKCLIDKAIELKGKPFKEGTAKF